MRDNELDKAVKSITVFARVSPADKLRIIQSLKPVSYTHLDVYKRQDLYCCRWVTRDKTTNMSASPIGSATLGSGVPSVSVSIKPDIIRSVSYTHL